MTKNTSYKGVYLLHYIHQAKTTFYFSFLNFKIQSTYSTEVSHQFMYHTMDKGNITGNSGMSWGGLYTMYCTAVFKQTYLLFGSWFSAFFLSRRMPCIYPYCCLWKMGREVVKICMISIFLCRRYFYNSDYYIRRDGPRGKAKHWLTTSKFDFLYSHWPT